MGGFAGFTEAMSGKKDKNGKDDNPINHIKKLFSKGGSGGGGESSGETEGGGLGTPAKHKGGMVKKSRTYRLLKGERVLTKKQAKSYKKKRG